MKMLIKPELKCQINLTFLVKMTKKKRGEKIELINIVKNTFFLIKT